MGDPIGGCKEAVKLVQRSAGLTAAMCDERDDAVRAFAVQECVILLDDTTADADLAACFAKEANRDAFVALLSGESSAPPPAEEPPTEAQTGHTRLRDAIEAAVNQARGPDGRFDTRADNDFSGGVAAFGNLVRATSRLDQNALTNRFRAIAKGTPGAETVNALATAILDTLDATPVTTQSDPIVTVEAAIAPVYDKARADDNTGAVNFEASLKATYPDLLGAGAWKLTPTLGASFQVEDSGDFRGGGLFRPEDVVTSEAGAAITKLNLSLLYSKNEALFDGSGPSLGIESRGVQLEFVNDAVNPWWSVGSVTGAGPLLRGQLAVGTSVFKGELAAAIGSGYFVTAIGDQIGDWNRWSGQAHVKAHVDLGVVSFGTLIGYQGIFGGTETAEHPTAQAVRLLAGLKIKPMATLDIGFGSFLRSGKKGPVDTSGLGFAGTVSYKYSGEQSLCVGAAYSHGTDTAVDRAIPGSGEVEFDDNGMPLGSVVENISHADETDLFQFGANIKLPTFWDPLKLSFGFAVGKAVLTSAGETISDAWSVEGKAVAELSLF